MMNPGDTPYLGRYTETYLSWNLYSHLWWSSRKLREYTYCTEMQKLLVESALRRGDVERADQMLVDWNVIESRHYTITKWSPGDHYYILDVKFDSQAEAEIHGRRHGFNKFTLKITKIPKPWE